MRICAFCGKTAELTGEHIWSAWLRKLIDTKKFFYRRQFAGDPNASSWVSNNLDLKARVVWSTCNNGWMSDLESNEAKPTLTPLILDTTQQTLSPKQLTSIAHFTFKHAVVGHFMDRNSRKYRKFFQPRTLRRFARTLDIPDNVQMWASAIRGSSRHGSLRMRYIKTKPGQTNGFHVYAFTYSVGHFVDQMTIGRWTSSRNRKISSFWLTPNIVWDEYCTPVWPNADKSSVSWPPVTLLNDETLEAFSERWRNPCAIPTTPVCRAPI